jgi:GNAT superfamily N-acetyltransferase
MVPPERAPESGDFLFRRIMDIQQATTEDIDTIIELIGKNEAAQAHFPGFLERKEDSPVIQSKLIPTQIHSGKYAYFIAIFDQIPVGLLAAAIYEWPTTKDERFGTLEKLFVDEEHRGKGIAEQLVQAATSWLNKLEVYILDVNVFDDNVPAQRFWDKMGFKSIVTLKYKDTRRK